jgi:hypothetical protein
MKHEVGLQGGGTCMLHLWTVLLEYTNNIHIVCDPNVIEWVADPDTNMTKLISLPV